MNRYFLITFFLSVSSFVHADNYPKNESIDIQHYYFTLELNDSTNAIRGEAIIKILFKKSISQFELDLINRNAQGQGMKIVSVFLGTNKVSYTHQHNRIAITLPQSSKAGEELSFIITYEGVPIDGLIINKNKYGDRTFFGDNWPDRARHWLPTIDHPYDKAKTDFTVIAPDHYQVISNGIKIEESTLPKKRRLTHWHEVKDLPTKIMTIGVAQFATELTGNSGNTPVESWMFYQNKEQGFKDFAVAPNVLNFMSNRIGPYPYHKLANIQSKTRWGGMENASAIFYAEEYPEEKDELETLIAHEIAHQWFGNTVTEKDWHHLWLSEGFASYFANVYNEFTYGQDRRAADMSQDRTEVIKYAKVSYLPIINTSVTDYNQLINTNSYQKGSWVLHMLRKKVGEEAFWKGIRLYYQKYEGKNVVTEDFQEVIEATSRQDLQEFFNRWVYRAGHPVVEWSWLYNPDKNVIEVTVTQVHKGSLFNFPLEIGLYFESGGLPVFKTIQISQQEQTFSLNVSKKPVTLVLDPHVDLLFEQNYKN